MSKNKRSRLRFNFSNLLDANLGSIRYIELDYPAIQLEEITLAPLQGTFKATRTSRGIYLEGLLQSELDLKCTRCLAPVEHPIEMALDDLFYHPFYMAPDGEYAVDENDTVDMAPLVRELALLEIPIQVYCRPDCKGVCSQCGQNLNEGTCDCEKDDVDPRLAKLKQLLDE